MTTNYNMPTEWSVARTADFSGDGIADLLWRNSLTNEVAIWRQGSSGSTAATAALPFTVGSEWQATSGDVNLDGKQDLAWRNSTTGENALWLMNGTTFTSVALPTVTDLNWKVGGMGDFNGDFQADLVWRNEVTQVASAWILGASGFASSLTIASGVTANYKVMGVADFNYDGKGDLLWRDANTGENYVWLMNGGTQIGGARLYDTDANWAVAGTADLTGDNKADIFWRNTSTGASISWAMDGATIASSVSYTNRGATYSVRGVADANADGKADVLWDYAGVQRSGFIWKMDGSTDPTGFVVHGSGVDVSSLAFSGNEGDRGTFNVKLVVKPATDTFVQFNGDTYTAVDRAVGGVVSGGLLTIGFSSANWDANRAMSFFAGPDGAATTRTAFVDFTTTGGLVGGGRYNLPNVVSTSAPNPSAFNIDLDYSSDLSGWWTPARRAIAQTAANDWAGRILNEWTPIAATNLWSDKIDSYPTTTNTQILSRRYVDDLVVYMNADFTTPGFQAAGGPDYAYGGWYSTPGVQPRVGQVSVKTAVYTDLTLYQVISHEIGHVLGLLGMNATSDALMIGKNTSTPSFAGTRSKLANNNVNIPGQVAGGVFGGHPADTVQSIMSYGYLYNSATTKPYEIDFAMLADSGYSVSGYN